MKNHLCDYIGDDLKYLQEIYNEMPLDELDRKDEINNREEQVAIQQGDEKSLLDTRIRRKLIVNAKTKFEL